MSFMKPEFYKGKYTSYEDKYGSTFFIPNEYLTEDTLKDATCIETYSGRLCRLSADGYLDCTEWTPCLSERNGRDLLSALYGNDDDNEGLYD